MTIKTRRGVNEEGGIYNGVIHPNASQQGNILYNKETFSAGDTTIDTESQAQATVVTLTPDLIAGQNANGAPQVLCFGNKASIAGYTEQVDAADDLVLLVTGQAANVSTYSISFITSVAGDYFGIGGSGSSLAGVYDGANAAQLKFNAPDTTDEHIWALVLERGTATVYLYFDGALVGTANAASVGVIDPTNQFYITSIYLSNMAAFVFQNGLLGANWADEIADLSARYLAGNGFGVPPHWN